MRKIPGICGKRQQGPGVVPSRKVALAWRASFDRPLAVETVAAAIADVKMPCLRKTGSEPLSGRKGL